MYLLVALVAMGVFHVGFPMARIFPAPYNLAGLVLIALAVTLVLWAALHFRRARTGIVPFSPATSLVTSGPYRFTRNPMYLGMAGVLLGAGVFLGSVTPFIVLPAFVTLIRDRFILAEEEQLEAAFGERFLEYKARVHRWL